MTRKRNKPRIIRTYPQRKPKPPGWLQILIPFAAFAWLAYASEPYGHGYTKQERAAMDALHLRVTSKKRNQAGKMAPQAKRAAIMDVWNITEEEAARPVILWK